jgi:CheY-like chemotaxis protein
LIEDDSRLAGMLGEYLGKAGFRVIHAESGTRGLTLHAREPVDVIILDLMLPDSGPGNLPADSRPVRQSDPDAHGAVIRWIASSRLRNGRRRLSSQAI